MNKLTLAVAGGRKTQSIIDRCLAAPRGRRILVVTYTMANQDQLKSRLSRHRPMEATVDVQGWFGFLLSHWVRPYLPKRFPGRRLTGFDFPGDPGRYATGENRFLDQAGRAYKLHLAQLALETDGASSGSVVDRLTNLYDEIHIDEVQDLNGYDLEVLARLMNSTIDLNLVGDVRQAILHTNPQERRHKPYKGLNIKKWFEEQEFAGNLEIEHQATTYRSIQTIADFADGLFDPSLGFAPTVSVNAIATGHDGLFAVATEHARPYLETFDAMCLRRMKTSAKSLELPFRNIGVSKGLESQHVLVAPTDNVTKYLRNGKALEPSAACYLYVAVTRARASIAFVCDRPELLRLPIWTP
jgi:superfamily I DNA/RNA helicase